MPAGERTGVTLWIGGTSSLTRTFVNQYGPQGLILLGLEAQPPTWIHTHTPFLEYVSCDLTTLHDDQVRALLSRHSEITSIVIGVRPLLFAPYANNMEGPRRMIQGIERLLQEACQHLPKLQFVLHISSVAAMDHLRTQQFVSEEAPFPPWQEYKASYDIFKRQCEETITQICSRNNIFYCHLRLSAIFSDDAACIQCRALNLQRRMGCYLPLAIDCNSSAKVLSCPPWSLVSIRTTDTKNATCLLLHTTSFVGRTGAVWVLSTTVSGRVWTGANVTLDTRVGGHVFCGRRALVCPMLSQKCLHPTIALCGCCGLFVASGLPGAFL